MKKVLFFAVAAIALAGMASCANKETSKLEGITVEDTVVNDTVNDGDSVQLDGAQTEDTAAEAKN